MNQFFLKPLLTSSPTNEQSDYERLLKLCESYGLNEEETQQLMDEFKKGGYDKANSMKSSLSQSMMSDHYDQMEKAPSESENQQKKVPRTYSDNFYQHREYQNSLANPSKSTDRYFGYQEEHQQVQQNDGSQGKNSCAYQDDEISYNEMTFNHQHENLEKFNTGEVDVKLINKANNYMVDAGKKLKGNDSKASLTEKQTQNPQSVPHSQRNSIHQSSHNQSVSSTHSQNSHRSIENPQLNPVYVKQLIYNFQLLEKQNDYLKQQNASLEKQQKTLSNEHQKFKKDYQLIKKQRDDFKAKNLLLQSEYFQLKSVLDSQKNKNQTFKQIKQRDSQIMQGLKDSILQFTSILKEKDARNHELQNKLILVYEKNEKLSHQIYSTGQTQNNDNTLQKIIEKLGSKKNLSSKNEGKQERINIQNQMRRQQWKENNENDMRKQIQMKREKGRNQTRRQLGEILMNSINAPQPQEMIVSQSNKQLMRETSTAKIVQSQNDQHNMEKQSVHVPRRPPREVKQNVFVGVEVESGDHGKVGGNKKVSVEEESKRRSSSRVDIRKYKGMIEQLRNNYSNVPGNMIR